VSPGPTVLFSEPEIRRRVRELGRQITRDYAGRSPVLVSVLKGGTMFLADLFRHIDLPVRVDFMSISPYRGDSEETGGVVRILKDLDEDIIDTGLTLSYLLASLQARQPRSLEVCTLLDRTARRIAPLHIRYRGFECPDVFVVGYGLDHGERYRNVPAILALETPAALAEDPDALLPFLGTSGPAPSR
jgi:hypoxanthine phosphoribosyltransferase